MNEEVLATVKASVPRRWIGVGMLIGVGVIVIYVAFRSPPQLGWQVFLIATGILALWTAEKMRRATEQHIELTQDELRSSDGTVLVRIEDVAAVERGAFAFKPSNGFLVRTHSKGDRAWRPGLWWRLGRRIGVGGVTPGAQTKAMSEILAAMLMQRDQGGDPLG
ncbi:hypothetical protein LCL97_02185 [Seohaeicola saemankumensis]|nr:hypothetical protein [Seohaeicola saemankumensis]MCA0869624.1 hypothetical protein [Seohaeicola saemankumensis]